LVGLAAELAVALVPVDLTPEDNGLRRELAFDLDLRQFQRLIIQSDGLISLASLVILNF